MSEIQNTKSPKKSPTVVSPKDGKRSSPLCKESSEPRSKRTRVSSVELEHESENLKILETLQLKVKLLSDSAKLPIRASPAAAGYDLFCSKGITIAKGSLQCVETDIAIAVPSGHYGRIAPRSGLALRSSINVGGGVVDQDYRGPLGVLLFNHGENDFEVKIGDRIAQLIIQKISTPEVCLVSELDETSRGESGFGSTGIQ